VKQKGLTLIELLVVVAIITLLLATLVLPLQNSRDRAKALLCSLNIRELTLGLLAYEMENEIFPHALDSTPKGPPLGGYAGNIAYDRGLIIQRAISEKMIKTKKLCFGVHRER
jgi:prepilin-type N-terminal cleavage/methylation domain-containing protein